MFIEFISCCDRHTHSVDLKGQILTKLTVKNTGLKKKKSRVNNLCYFLKS